MTSSFTSLVTPTHFGKEPAYWLIFKGNKLLVHMKGTTATLPRYADSSDSGMDIIRSQYLGYLEKDDLIHCYSAEVSDGSLAPEGMSYHSLRPLFGVLDEDLFWLAGRAIQIVDWDRSHQFCSRCGATTETMPTERAKLCPVCGFTSYPRLSPAIIVRVQRDGEYGKEILLGRGPRYTPGMYSVLAGFVEPGETLEECVRREVKEEVSIELKNIRYFGSQPWPFPNSLMVGFTADYAGGEIVLEEEEMEEAKWFQANALPNIPSPLSISRRLIDDFVSKNSSGD